MCRFKFHFLIALLTFGIGVFAASLLINSLDTNRPLPENLQGSNHSLNQEQPSTKQSVSETDDKIEGWKIPLPKNKKRFDVKAQNMRSEDGQSVKATRTIYAGSNLTDKPFNSRRLNQTFGLCELGSFTELKVNDKIFFYAISAFQVKLDEQTGRTIRLGPPFSYRYVDTDGDGDFETNLIGDAPLLVPSWVTK